jgi:2-polyprenyl-3-methyl-5-hydroxy-6-metoxy-1,4-benzoquinol methylase
MSYFEEEDLRALDSLVKDVERDARDAGELVQRLSTFSLRLKGDVSHIVRTDPYSAEYVERVKTVHEEIIGKQHRSEFEGLPVLNLEYESEWPYPWGTKCAETVGRVLIAYGFLIKAASLGPSARILEVGCGMGSLTWNLARMGYRVDALDPNPKQCECVLAVTNGFPVKPRVVAATLEEWMHRKEKSYKYDAVIFFESFHHIMNHRECLTELLADHMEVDGRVLLAAEPILEEVCDVLPYPWGPRLDGESIRAMRNWGWLELGFTKSYIEGLFQMLGLEFEWLKSEVSLPHSQVIRGHRKVALEAKGVAERLRYKAKLSDGIDFRREGLPEFVAECVGLSYREQWGRWSEGGKVEIRLASKLPKTFALKLELASVFGPNVGKKLRLNVGTQETDVILETIEARSTYTVQFDSVESDRIEIAIPHPFRPKDMPELCNEDSRRIGIGIQAVFIEEKDIRPRSDW